MYCQCNEAMMKKQESMNTENMKNFNPSNLKVGSIIETSINGIDWTERTITRTSDKYVWFSGGGYDRTARQTFLNHSKLYRIKSI